MKTFKDGQTPEENAKFVEWAKRATAGLDDSATMLGVLMNKDSPYRWEFALQIGHCLLEGKPLLLLIEKDTKVPEKLRLAATAIEEFDPAIGEESYKAAMRRLFAAVDLEVKH